jgi:hypothetical protein
MPEFPSRPQAPRQQGPGGRPPFTREPLTPGPMMGEEFPGQEFRGRPRAPAAFGGIMDTYTGRRKYGLGSFFSKALKKVKKLASSKLGKIALMYVAGTYLGGTAAFGGTGYAGAAPWKKFGAQLLDPMGKEGIANIGRKAMSYFKTPTPKVASYADDFVTTGKALTGTGQLTGGSEILPNAYKLAQMTDWEKAASLAKLGTGQAANTFLGIPKNVALGIGIPSVGAGLYTAAQPPEELGGELDTEYDTKKADFDRYLAGLDTYEGGDFRVPVQYRAAQGGRIGRQEGGLMDLGGMEKDYRDDGGFVPLGGEEKADDVPARLSKNEFVFTADAVRNAGGGDIDRGAEVMENVMKNLEAGGKVSEESQGQGAEEMFEVSERLSEVV